MVAMARSTGLAPRGGKQTRNRLSRLAPKSGGAPSYSAGQRHSEDAHDGSQHALSPNGVEIRHQGFEPMAGPDPAAARRRDRLRHQPMKNISASGNQPTLPSSSPNPSTMRGGAQVQRHQGREALVATDEFTASASIAALVASPSPASQCGAIDKAVAGRALFFYHSRRCGKRALSHDPGWLKSEIEIGLARCPRSPLSVTASHPISSAIRSGCTPDGPPSTPMRQIVGIEQRRISGSS